MTQTALIQKTPAYSLNKIGLIKCTIADGATDDELALFLQPWRWKSYPWSVCTWSAVSDPDDLNPRYQGLYHAE